MSGKVIKGRIDFAKSPEASKASLICSRGRRLFGNFDFKATLGGGLNDGVGFAEFVGDGRFEEDVQARLNRHQPHFAIRAEGRRQCRFGRGLCMSLSRSV